MGNGERQVSVETSDNVFYQFPFHDLIIKGTEFKHGQVRHFDDIHFDKIDKSWHLGKEQIRILYLFTWIRIHM